MVQDKHWNNTSNGSFSITDNFATHSISFTSCALLRNLVHMCIGSTLHQQGTILGFFRPSTRRRVRDTTIVEARIFLGTHHFQGSFQTRRFPLEQGDAMHRQHKELLSLNAERNVRLLIVNANEDTSFLTNHPNHFQNPSSQPSILHLPNACNHSRAQSIERRDDEWAARVQLRHRRYEI